MVSHRGAEPKGPCVLAPGAPLRYALLRWLMGLFRFTALRNCPGMRVAKRNAREEKNRPFGFPPRQPPHFRNLRRKAADKQQVLRTRQKAPDLLGRV